MKGAGRRRKEVYPEDYLRNKNRYQMVIERLRGAPGDRATRV